MFAWSTDIHLDHITPESPAYQRWLAALTEPQVSRVLLTGDLADAHSVIPWLERLSQDTQRPIYFVLGNHDYYHGSISEVREAFKRLEHAQLFWLDQRGPLIIEQALSLVGVGGWGDGRVGDFLATPVRLNDHRLIKELTISDRSELLKALQALGMSEAQSLKAQLEQTSTPHVIVATHVPPFRESTWYHGRYGDWDWMPDFCCGAVGEVLLSYAESHPEQTLNVYCGHSHGEGAYYPLSNLSVFTGRAEYGHPRIQGLLDQHGRLLDQERYLQA